MGPAETLLNFLLGLIAAGLLAAPVASRLPWLARHSVGWVMYLANVVLETAEKRLPVTRGLAECLLVAVGCALLWQASGAVWLALAVFVGYGFLVMASLLRERRIINDVYAIAEPAGLRSATSRSKASPAPGLHPVLSLNLEGPFISRTPELALGILPAGRTLRLILLVGNHSRVPSQAAAQVQLVGPDNWIDQDRSSAALPALQPGQVERLEWTLTPTPGDAAGELLITVSAGRFAQTLVVRHHGCREIQPQEVQRVSITRYPGARRAAFCWRGDMDLYDTASFQDIAGLEDAFGLGARYAMAQTMYLSTRLSLDQAEADQWANHYGVDRGAEHIPAFIDWMNKQVDLRHSAPWPVASERPYVIELGNHGHLHYDTDTSGHPGNDWKAGACPGGGTYPWSRGNGSSLDDQRDNIREATRWCEEKLGFKPRSWAKPGRGNDEFTPLAVEEAGMEVATGSDIRPRDNVLRQPPPHFPKDTQLLELTARYPSDPQHTLHAAMLEFWLCRGHRLGLPVIFLVHQHMRQFDGVVCSRLTEHLLDRVVRHFDGDFYIDTVYGIGRYWLDVLSGDRSRVQVEGDGANRRVVNKADRAIDNIPVDVKLRTGECLTRLVSLNAGESVSLASLLGVQE